jgi:signal transduction histidine kinase
MDAPDAGGRLGLVGMRERIAMVGGTLDVESSPGGATTLFVRIPTDGSTPDES